MEYRCYVVGDAVTEPGALLRRLLYQPFPDAEERALSQQSLLFTRSEEAKGTNTYTMAVSLPNLHDTRSASLTLPNPSMPAVDITIQFAAISDPREFERVMLSHHSTSAFPGAGHGGGGAFGRSLRRSFSSPTSSYQDLMSSDVSSMPSNAHGFALQAPPHAIVLTFNPFSLCSFSKLRLEWVHSLRVLRQQRQQMINAVLQQQQQQQQLQRQSKRSTSAVFGASSVPASPLTPGYPMESIEGFPVVLLVATRMELMRDTMEATPSVHVPSSLEVAEVAQALQAQAYVEVGTNWDDSLDVLRATIARAVMGELANAPLVMYNTAYVARQGSIAHAIEAAQMDPYEEGDDEGNNYPTAATSAAVTKSMGDSTKTPLTNQDASTQLTREEKMQDDNNSTTSADQKRSAKEQREDEDQSRETNTAAAKNADDHERNQKSSDSVATQARNTDDDARNDERANDAGASPLDHDSAVNNTKQKRNASFNSTSATVTTAVGAADADLLNERAASECNTSEIFTRSANLSSFVDHQLEQEGKGKDALKVASGNTSMDAASAETSMRGRQLRRHLVTALAPLIVPEDKRIPLAADPAPNGTKTKDAGEKGNTQSEAAVASAALHEEKSKETVEVVQSRKQQDPSPSSALRPRRRHSSAPHATTSPLSKWTWRRHPRTRRVFYVDRASGKSQYECPAEYDGPAVTADEKGGDAQQTQGNTNAMSQERTGSLEQQTPPFQQQEGSERVANYSSSAGPLPPKESPTSLKCASSPLNGATTASAKEKNAVAEEGPHEDVSSWRQRQQVQLRHTQVQRLEHQIHQLRLQSERLRAQSEANADLKVKVAELRTALDAQEQAFSATVAEQNQQLAADLLDATVAVEELSALVLGPVVGEDANRPSEGGEGKTREHPASAGSSHGVSSSPASAPFPSSVDGGAALPAGLAREVQRLDQELKEAVESLQCALQHRDTEVVALETLQRRQQHVTQHTRDAEAELTRLAKETSQLESSRLSLDTELESVRAEKRGLQEQLRHAEGQLHAQEQQRQTQLAAYVQAKRAAQEQAEKWERLHQLSLRVQGEFRDALRACGLSDRLRTSAVLEEGHRLRLGLESATGRCGEALLRNAEGVFLLPHLAHLLEDREHRVEAQLEEQGRRLQQAYDDAEEQRAYAVQARYSTMRREGKGATSGRLTMSPQSYDAAAMELREAGVEACAEALERWQQHSDSVAAPLLERTRSVTAELLLLARDVSDRLRDLPIASSASNLLRHSEKNQLGSQEAAQCAEYLAARIAGVSHSIEEVCQAPLAVFTKWQRERQTAGLDVGAETNANVRVEKPSFLVATKSPEVKSVTGDGVFSESRFAATMERVLWETCDGLVNRLPNLDETFTEMYRRSRKPSP